MAETGVALLETLGSLLRILDERRAEYMLVGGIALAAFAPPRATTDIDPAVAGAAALTKTLARALGGAASMRPVRDRADIRMLLEHARIDRKLVTAEAKRKKLLSRWRRH